MHWGLQMYKIWKSQDSRLVHWHEALSGISVCWWKALSMFDNSRLQQKCTHADEPVQIYFTRKILFKALHSI